MSLFGDSFFSPIPYTFSLPLDADDFDFESAPSSQVAKRGPRHTNMNPVMGPRVDVHEVSSAYEVSAELPGALRENIKIALDANTRKVIISGEIKNEYHMPAPPAEAPADKDKQDQGKGDEVSVTKTDSGKKSAPHHHGPRPLISERFYGHFSRSFILPKDADCDSEEIKAKFENGLLKLTIPKKTEVKKGVRSVTIENAAE
ncbi:hypothetical protein OC846_000390 [Tilletia horrida]|uniref:SHSP domain-containing protein n=1 Tax=Tilletia horrida TaxID=155126 RepID=A0AAN6JUS5_9BASI|nr:hypothetical protein OC845_000022 [Tilletia horrida]KAK0557602.1 hypothetical protein OC846_000390 [Tilletia horrida]